MYDYIRGKLAKIYPIAVVLENNNIGYRVLVPVSLHSHLPSLGQEMFLYLSYVVRDVSQTLYGFISEVERDLFNVLIDISGVGPKLALSMIGHLTPMELQNSILKNDTKILCQVPGIGKKTAERLIIELRDKLSFIVGPVAFSCNVMPTASLLNDAMSALVNLGYNPLEAQRMVKKSLEVAPEADLGELITFALKAK